MSDSLSSVWGHTVHFAKFPILKEALKSGLSAKRLILRLCGKYDNQGEIEAVPLWRSQLSYNYPSTALRPLGPLLFFTNHGSLW